MLRLRTFRGIAVEIGSEAHCLLIDVRSCILRRVVRVLNSFIHSIAFKVMSSGLRIDHDAYAVS